jgi:hypothetical protein
MGGNKIMAKSTEHLALYEAEKTDGTLTFNIQKMMNDNWDKLDADSKAKDTNITNINNAIGSAVLSTTDKTVKGAINEVKNSIPSTLPANGGHANTTDKFQTARNIALTGDVTGTASFDGSKDASIDATLKNSGVAVGTYRSVTVDAKGRVTAGTNPTTRDGYGLSDVPTKDEVNTTINDLEIGGVNLCKGTKDFSDKYWTITGNVTCVDSTENLGSKTIKYVTNTVINSIDNTIYSSTASQGFDFSDTSKTWTVSAYVRGSKVGQKIGITISAARINWQPKNIIVDDKTHRMSWTFQGDGNSVQMFRFEINGATLDNPVYIRNIQVEEGDKATTWTPAPEDQQAYVDAQISDINNLINNLSTNDIEARREILDMKLKLDENDVMSFLSKTGIGFYDLFKNTENIDTTNSTATIVNTDTVFTGEQLLKFLEQQFDSFKTVELAIYDSERKSINVDTNVDNSQTIEATVSPDSILVGDKFYFNGEIYTVDNVQLEG